MPGYGGLEVCQRLKESGETMRIPILLTVGKMEPFKADEAKRVRADGHIVKPFEASELLAALTRLEDRIVPQPEPARGRKGKTEKTEKKARSWHVPTDPAQVPEEWTDKIAHLASAKERLVNREPEPEAEPVQAVAQPTTPPPQQTPVAVSEPAPEMPVVAATEPTLEEQELAGSTVADVEQNAPVEENSAAVEEKSEEPEAVPEVADTAGEMATAPEAQPVQQESASEEVTEPVAAAEVETEQPSVEPAPAESADVPEALQAAVAEVAALNVPAAKPRWVAENVAVRPEEATLELDQEMQQAQMEAASAITPADVPVAEAVAPAVEESIAAESAGEPHEIEPEERKGATFAAAASASGNAVASVKESVPDDEPGSAGPDAAAAWQNWQQIRDSVMTPQSASALAESVAQVAKAVVHAPSAQVSSETADESSAVSSLESETLASIVDSVLAELKPRLMQEIAKKLKK
jgi:hypothetical protein